MTVGLLWLAMTWAAGAAPTDTPLSLAGPQLCKGDELVYLGKVEEVGVRPEGRWTRVSELEVRVFVLDVNTSYTDCAVLTSVLPLDDELVVQAVKVASGRPQRRQKQPSVQVELIRVDERGGTKRLQPKLGVRPLQFDEHTPTTPVPPTAMELAPSLELGPFVPLPITNVKFGETWDQSESGRAPMVRVAKAEAVWNGRRCIEVQGVQKSDGFEATDTVRRGWQRNECVLISPVEGVASTLTRSIQHRAGREIVGTLTVNYELQPSQRATGQKYLELRAEAEAAWLFASELKTILAGQIRPQELRALSADLERHLETNTTTSFRPAITGIKRQLETAGTTTPTVAVAPKISMQFTDVEPPQVGQPAPDVSVAQVEKLEGSLRLSAVENKPVLLVFYKPYSETSQETLAVCQALHEKYAATALIVPLAIRAPLLDAAKQRAELKLTVPIYDGQDAKPRYQVRSFPQFFLVDAQRKVAWTFLDGIGPEVGFLAARELDKIVEATKPKK